MPKAMPLTYAEFYITHQCNQQCEYCSEADKIQSGKVDFVPAGLILECLERLRKDGIEAVFFSGGETLLHPDIETILEQSVKMGFRNAVATNGTYMTPEMFESVAPYIHGVDISFPAHNEELFEKTSGCKGKYRDLEIFVESLKNHFGKIYCMANVVVTNTNLMFIEEIVRRICDYSIFKLILLSNVAPQGRALQHYAELAPRLTDIYDVTDKVKKFLHGGNVELHVFGVPFCILGVHGANSNDISFYQRLNIEVDPDCFAEGAGGDIRLKTTLLRNAARDRVHPAEICSECSCFNNTFCGGVFPEYIELYGTDELSPFEYGTIKKKKSAK